MEENKKSKPSSIANIEKARLKRLTTIKNKKEADDYKRLLELHENKFKTIDQTEKESKQTKDRKIKSKSKIVEEYSDNDSDSSSEEEFVYVQPKKKDKKKEKENKSEIEELKKVINDMKNTQVSAPIPAVSAPIAIPPASDHSSDNIDDVYLKKLIKYKILNR